MVRPDHILSWMVRRLRVIDPSMMRGILHVSLHIREYAVESISERFERKGILERLLAQLETPLSRRSPCNTSINTASFLSYSGKILEL